MAYVIADDIVSNGATLEFGSTELGPIADINPSFVGAEIDTSGLDDEEDMIEVGGIAARCECTVIGAITTLMIGDKGDLVVTLASSDTIDMGHCVVVAQPITISRNARIETKLTFARTREEDGS